MIQEVDLPAGWCDDDGRQVDCRENDCGAGITLRSRRRGECVAWQELDATPFRGRRVRLRLELGPRTECCAVYFQARTGSDWLAVDRPFPHLHREHPMRHRTAELDVPPDADRLRIGLGLPHGWAMPVLHAELQVVGTRLTRREPSRSLTAWQLEVLTALVRLVDAVRWFDPSPEVIGADWDSVLPWLVRDALSTRTPAQLATLLRERFGVLAPGVAVAMGPLPELTSRRSFRARPVLAWEHLGVAGAYPPATSRLVDITRPVPAPFEGASMTRVVDAAPYRGRRVTVTVEVLAERERYRTAGLALMCFTGPLQMAFRWSAFPSRGSWATARVSMQVPTDAHTLRLTVANDLGQVRVRRFAMQVDGDGGEALDALLAPSPTAARSPVGWHCGEGVRVIGSGSVEPEVRLAADTLAVARPLPGEHLEIELGRDLRARVPITARLDRSAPTRERPSLPLTPTRPVPGWRHDNLAAVLSAWSILGRFSPQAPPQETWIGLLAPTLQSVARARSDAEVVDALSTLLVATCDSHGVITRSEPVAGGCLPLRWNWTRDRLVVTAVAPQVAGRVPQGSVITAIGGVPVSDLITARLPYTSGATEGVRLRRIFDEQLLGQLGTSVRLTVVKRDGMRGSVRVVRSVPRDSPPGLVGAVPPASTGYKPIHHLDKDVVVVDLGRVTGLQLSEAAGELARARAVVLDLRRYCPPDLTWVLEHFIEQPIAFPPAALDVTAHPGEHGRFRLPLDEVRFARVVPRAPYVGADLYWLVDEGTASLPEWVVQCVREHGLGTVIGSRTGGAHSFLNTASLPGGWTVGWTQGIGSSFDGEVLRGGLGPDLLIENSVDDLATGRDRLTGMAVALARGAVLPEAVLGSWRGLTTSGAPLGWKLSTPSASRARLLPQPDGSLIVAAAEGEQAALVQRFQVGGLAGRRVRASMTIQAERDRGPPSVGMGFDVISAGALVAGADTAHRPPAAGGKGKRVHDIVLDVASESAYLVLRVSVDGPGEVSVGPIILDDLGTAGQEDGLGFVPLLETDTDQARMTAATNLGFDDGPRRDGRPQGWGSTGTLTMELDTTVSRLGAGSSVKLTALSPTTHPARLGQSVPGTAFHGRRVCFGAWIKTQGPATSGAHVRLAVVTPTGADEHTSAPAVGTTDWTWQSVEVTVPEDCDRLSYGVECMEGIIAWVDDCTFSSD